MGIPEFYTSERNKKTTKEVERTLHDNRSAPGGTFLYDRAAHFENIEPQNPSRGEWCIPADMEEGNYLMMDPACEDNEKDTRGKNDGNKTLEEGSSPPLDLDSDEEIERIEETLPYAEEDWHDPEQMEVPKNLEPDLPFAIQTRQSDR